MRDRIKNAVSKYFLFIILIALFTLFIIFYPQLKALASVLISLYGLLGLFILVVLMDTIIQPISPDILIFSSTFGGASLFWASLIGGAASCIAGSIGYVIGRALGEDGFKRWYGQKHLHKGQRIVKKYGVWAVVIGALSPVPYSAVCWTVGIYKMRYSHFLLISIATRIPRFFLMGLLGYLL